MPFVLLACMTLGGIDTVHSRDFSRAQQTAAVIATVKVRNLTRQANGSGVIVGRKPTAIYILTAYHLVTGTHTLEVTTFSASSYPDADQRFRSAVVVTHLDDEDLALLEVPTRAAPPAILPICRPRHGPKGARFPVLATGCTQGDEPTARICTVVASAVITRAHGGPARMWEVKPQPEPGRSGGPLIDRAGYVIGIASGRAGDRGYYSHLSEIRRLLKRGKAEWLYKQTAPRPPAAAAPSRRS